MNIISLNSAILNNTNFKQRTTAARYIASMAATTAILYKDATSDNFCNKKLNHILNNREEIFDEQYYQDYYNIDLNLANSRAFRDRELFNPLKDDERINYSGYDENDIELADNLIPKSYNENYSESFAEYNTINTDFGYQEMPDCVTKPYLTPRDAVFDAIDKKWLDKHSLYFIGEKIDCSIQRKIIIASTRRYFDNKTRIEPSLVSLGIELYKNSKDWTDTEDQIIDLVYKRNDAEMSKNITTVKIKLQKKVSNENILSFLLSQKNKKNKTSKS